MSIQSIPDTEAQMSMAEIFLANGKFPEARRHLEILAAQAPESTRVAYYRGVLARMAGDPAARDYFVDALVDPFLGPRAATFPENPSSRGRWCAGVNRLDPLRIRDSLTADRRCRAATKDVLRLDW